MKKVLWICLAALSACASGASMMTADSFYSIPIGATQDEIVSQAGEPARIRDQGCGVVEYEYVERLSVGGRLLQATHYIFTIQDGKVVSKRVERDSPSPLQFDSYDMQTTQK